MKAKIAIIDNNTDYLFSTETFLSRNGFRVVTAEDGKTGMDLIKKEKPDIVLLDVMMESLFSGFEVFRQLKSDPELKKIPVIGISGMANEIKVKFNETSDSDFFNPDLFFEKPVNKEMLLSKIKELLLKGSA